MIGFVGPGNLGAPMAQRLGRSGLRRRRARSGPGAHRGTDLPMTEAATGAFTRAIERYGADVGELHVAKRIEDDANLSYRLAGDWVPHWEK